MLQSQFLTDLFTLILEFNKELDLSMRFKTTNFKCLQKFGNEKCI